MSFMQTLFGTIAGDFFPDVNADFVPKDAAGEIVNLKGHDAVWMGLRNPLMQKAAYDFCYPVASVIDKLTGYDLNGTVEVVKLRGKGKEEPANNDYSKAVNTLLANPNKYQTWFEFRGEQKIYKKIFGYCITLGFKSVGFGDTYAAAINLPNWQLNIVAKPRRMAYDPLSNRIQSITWNVDGYAIPIPLEDIMILEDTFIQDSRSGLCLPQSRLIGLDMDVSNLCAAKEADNVLLRKKGPLGFISHDAAAVKDSISGYVPMSRGAKRQLQDDLTKYGLSLRQFQYVISRTAAKWNPMSYDVKGLGTKETAVASEKAVTHRYDLPYVLYEVSESTFSNSNQAHVAVYQDNVVPEADRDAAKLSKWLKAEQNDCKIIRDFSHLPVMQENLQEKGEGWQAMDDALEIEFMNDVITLNKWRMEMGRDTTLDGDVYYSQIEPKEQETVNQQ